MLSHSGLELIPREESLRLLAGQAVGRLAFNISDQPMILPVNYALVDGFVVFRTAEGTKLDVLPTTKVAFEVDQFDPETRTGWSVVVQGRPEEITTDPNWFVKRLRDAAVSSWATGDRDHYVRIIPHAVSGRRILPSG
jgi:nitroimidazol reductase NimA-like FMN-containing flavoprotein (pyridoxamine 5'-phosphate oxidase superfamily)